MPVTNANDLGEKGMPLSNTMAREIDCAQGGIHDHQRRVEPDSRIRLRDCKRRHHCHVLLFAEPAMAEDSGGKLTASARFRRILVPLDGSKLAERALTPAVAIAGAMSAKLFLLRVATPLSLKLDPRLYASIIRIRRNEAKEYLRSIQFRLSFARVNIDTAVAVGQPAEVISRFIHDNKIDLIVMSSLGHSGIKRWVYGSVANKVLHTASCAKAIIHPQVVIDPFVIKRILVPLDGSHLAEQALNLAQSLAEAAQAELYLLQAIADTHSAELDWPGKDQAADSEETIAKTYLQSVKAKMAGSPIEILTQVTTGSAAENIIDFADDQKVNLIIMGSRGRSGFQRLLFGSVATKVLARANCVTLVMPGPES